MCSVFIRSPASTCPLSSEFYAVAVAASFCLPPPFFHLVEYSEKIEFLDVDVVCDWSRYYLIYEDNISCPNRMRHAAQ